MTQLSLDLAKPTGRELRDGGMAQAMSTTEAKTPNWGETAYGYLLDFLATRRHTFSGEQVREFAHARGCPEPVHKRAWGGVVMRAAREGRIYKVGTVQVKNPQAHMANAALWSAT